MLSDRKTRILGAHAFAQSSSIECIGRCNEKPESICRKVLSTLERFRLSLWTELSAPIKGAPPGVSTTK